MGDCQKPAASARLAMTLFALVATAGGWLALAAGEAPAASSPGSPSLPTLEPEGPVPVVTTRSSR